MHTIEKCVRVGVSMLVRTDTGTNTIALNKDVCGSFPCYVAKSCLCISSQYMCMCTCTKVVG